MTTPRETIVIAHAWRWQDGNQTYADPGCDPVDGWCVYARHPIGDQPDGAFAATDETDFPNRAAAVEAGQSLADRLGVKLCIED